MSKMLDKLKKFLAKHDCKTREESDPRNIDENKMEKLLKKGAMLVDVRSPQEFKEGHFEAAINIPEYEIESKIEEAVQDKSQVIVLYCTSGYRSKKAKEALEKMGYENVFYLAINYKLW